MKQAWPSTIRTVKGDHKRFEETYFSAFPVSLLPPCCTAVIIFLPASAQIQIIPCDSNHMTPSNPVALETSAGDAALLRLQQ